MAGDVEGADFGVVAAGFLQQDIQLLAIFGPARLKLVGLAKGIRALIAEIVGCVVGDEFALAAEVTQK